MGTEYLWTVAILILMSLLYTYISYKVDGVSINSVIIFIIGISNYLLFYFLREIFPYWFLGGFFSEISSPPLKVIVWKWFYILIIISFLAFGLNYLYRKLFNGKLKYFKLTILNISVIAIFSLLTYSRVNQYWEIDKKDRHVVLLDDTSPEFKRLASVKIFFYRQDIKIIIDNDGYTGLTFNHLKLYKKTNLKGIYSTGINKEDLIDDLVNEPTYFLGEKEKLRNKLTESSCMSKATAICRGYIPVDQYEKIENISFWKLAIIIPRFLYEILITSINKAIITSLILVLLYFFRKDYFLVNE